VGLTISAEKTLGSPVMTLSASEIQRYKRHLLLKEIGGSGQQRLKKARVLAVGAGGLGSPLLLYLAAAGVGHIGVIDDDRVSLDNLQRQIAHDTAHIGSLKTESAAETVKRLNPHVYVEQIPERLTAANALDIIPAFDIVADGSDNFATRYLVNDACYFARRPLVFAALGPFDGYLSTFRAYEQAPGGDPWPSYRCIFPEAPPAGAAASCAEAGVLGAVAGVLGTLQAVEVIKEVLGIGASLCGKLMIYDALGARFETLTVSWDPNNPLTGRNPSIHDLSRHESVCGAPGRETGDV
jgi:molybdopterin/thiamine biosynthesis adenylyltransferase